MTLKEFTNKWSVSVESGKKFIDYFLKKDDKGKHVAHWTTSKDDWKDYFYDAEPDEIIEFIKDVFDMLGD